jgi:hypothetical protein
MKRFATHKKSVWSSILQATVLFALFINSADSIAAEKPITVVTWEADAEKIYDTGFMHMLMKNDSNEVILFDMDLVENDSPGAGSSEKGIDRDVIWGPVMARKVLTIDDPRTHAAYLIVYNHDQGDYPLTIDVNGKKTTMKTWEVSSYYQHYLWGEFPAQWLKKGENVFTLSCPQAKSEEEGWVLYLSRADEFERGGGNPANVGKTSFKSTDSGETWKESPFGPLGDTRAEFSVRLSMDRHVKEGWLATPVIDLWRGDSEDFYVRQHTIKKLEIALKADVPEGARIEYFMRRGTSPDPYSDKWENYVFIGEGRNVVWTAGREFNRRYLQLRMTFTADNPLVSPEFKSLSVRAEHQEHYPVPEHKNIRMLTVYNPDIEYSSLQWQWEKWDRPEFKELRERENLDELLAGTQTQFEKQVRLLEYASERWNWTTPQPEYPEWDALSIVERINMAGGGGMCIQHNNFLAGMCMAYGWQARLANVDGHEICEVWNDDHAKWIYIDASYNHYLWDEESIEPMNMMDIHWKYLDYFFPGKSIDWTTYSRGRFDPQTEEAGLKRGSLSHHHRGGLGGFFNGAFFRYVPRNNFYEKKYPRPLSHGNSLWPWNGYINWFDERTPRRRHYTWYTDRKRDIYPDLNTVHIHATAGPPKDRLYLEFETYTPNFCHFEVNTNNTGWRNAPANWTWLLRSGRNTLEARSVSKSEVTGKPSTVKLNFADVQFETSF